MLDKSIKRTAPAPCPLSKFFLYQVDRYVAFHDGPRIPSEFLRVLISRVPLSPSEFLRASPLRVSIRLIPLSFTVRQGPAKEDEGNTLRREGVKQPYLP